MKILQDGDVSVVQNNAADYMRTVPVNSNFGEKNCCSFYKKNVRLFIHHSRHANVLMPIQR